MPRGNACPVQCAASKSASRTTASMRNGTPSSACINVLPSRTSVFRLPEGLKARTVMISGAVLRSRTVIRTLAAAVFATGIRFKSNT